MFVITILCLCVGMEISFGMLPKAIDKRFDRNSSEQGVGVDEQTEQNRRTTPVADLDDDQAWLGSSDSGLPPSVSKRNQRNPRRQSSQRKFSNDQPTVQQQLATEFINYRQEIEEAAAAKRTRLAENLFKKQSSSQAQQNTPEDFSDREKVYQFMEALHTRQQEALEGIRADQAQLAKERRAPTGCFSLFYSPEKNFIARENAIHEKLVALLQEKISSHDLELEWLLSFSPKRNSLLGQSTFPDESTSSSSSAGNHEQQTAVETALREAQGVGQHFIDSFCKPTNQGEIDLTKLDFLSDEQLHFINEVIDLVRNTQLFILGYDSSSYITMSKEQLAKIENDLGEKIKALDLPPTEQLTSEPSRIDPIIKERYLAAQELLENSKAQFSLMETTPEGETIHAAAKSAKTIDEQAQKIKTEKEKSLESEVTETATSSEPQLFAEIAKMKDLHDCLLNTMLSYREIQDEAWIEKQCGNLNKLHDRLISAMSAISKNDLRLNADENTHHPSLLTTILNRKEFEIDSPLLQPESPLEFLDTLLTLDQALHNDRIIGTHGKIALEKITNAAQGNFTDQTRREWMAGINLIRRAICITRGIEVLNAFDGEFWKKIKESNSLKVHEVFNFLFHSDGQLKYPRSFFVDPNMSHEDFLKMLLAFHSDDSSPFDKIIKIDQATLDFNPFSKKPLNPVREEITAASLRQREAGFQYVRKALAAAFPEASLTNEQLEEVLQKFDTAFKVTPEGPFLTLESTRTFIEQEREVLRARSCWKKYVVGYFHQEEIQNMINGFYYSIGAHILPFALGILSFLYYLSLTHALT